MIKRKTLFLSAALILAPLSHADEPKQDGFTAETAIVIQARNEKDGPLKELEWVQNNFPGSKILRFVTRPSKDRKVYDVFFIQTKDGKSRQLYFEISSFYHKT